MDSNDLALSRSLLSGDLSLPVIHHDNLVVLVSVAVYFGVKDGYLIGFLITHQNDKTEDEGDCSVQEEDLALVGYATVVWFLCLTTVRSNLLFIVKKRLMTVFLMGKRFSD